MGSYNKEYFCPNCGAVLDEQSGFEPDNSTWTCTKCGQFLYGDDIYDGERFDGVIWHCDGCGAILNKQSGFSDYKSKWVCDECGYTNIISEENILDDDDEDDDDDVKYADWLDLNYWIKNTLSQSDDDDDKDDDDDDDDEDEDDDYSWSGRSITYSNQPQRGVNQSRTIEKKEGKDSSSGWLWSLLSMLVIFIGMIYALSMMGRQYTDAPDSWRKLRGENCYVVEQQFEDAGFTNIELIPVEDLSDGWIFKDTDKVDTVESVTIAGEKKFKKGDEFKKKDNVVIYYHCYPDD